MRGRVVAAAFAAGVGLLTACATTDGAKSSRARAAEGVAAANTEQHVSPAVETASGATLRSRLVTSVGGLRYRVDAVATPHLGGYVVDVGVTVTSADGQTHRFPDLPLRRATSVTLGRKGLGGCSKRASPGVNPPQVVAPRQRVELVLRLRPLTDPPTYLPGARLRAGVGLFDVQGPDGRTTQPAIATAELVVSGAGTARLALRPGVDADLKRRCWGTQD